MREADDPRSERIPHEMIVARMLEEEAAWL